MATERALPATPYQSGQLESFGSASYMLLSQFDFPDHYEDGVEPLIGRDSDRLQEADPMHVRVVLKRYHCGSQDISFLNFNQPQSHLFEGWARKQRSKAEMISFIKALLKADQTINWTGCRIMGTVSDNGHAIFRFELFARNPAGETSVFTGEPAPNILGTR